MKFSQNRKDRTMSSKKLNNTNIPQMKWFRADDIFLGEYGFTIAYTQDKQSVDEEIWLEPNDEWRGGLDFGGMVKNEIFFGNLDSGFFRTNAEVEDFYALNSLETLELEKIILQESEESCEGDFQTHCDDGHCYIIPDTGFDFSKPAVLTEQKRKKLNRAVKTNWEQQECKCCLNQDLFAVNGWGYNIHVIFQALDEKDALLRLQYLKEQVAWKILNEEGEQDPYCDGMGELEEHLGSMYAIQKFTTKNTKKCQPLTAGEPKNWKNLARAICEEDREIPICHNTTKITSNIKPNNLLDEFISDEDEWTRIRVARLASYINRDDLLDKLVNDESYRVRLKVANGAGKLGRTDLLDKLANDEDKDVRLAVAKQAGKLGREDLLDKLVNDESYRVRLKVAWQGYGLDKLVDDKNTDVRAAVAEQGYALDKLVNDKDYRVLNIVLRQAKELGRKDLLEKLAGNSNCTEIMYTEIMEQAIKFNKSSWLNKLANSAYKNIRKTVAEQGCGLDKLVYDKNKDVRMAVAKNAGRVNRTDLLEKLAYDESVDIRKEVARQGYGLDRLIDDEDHLVRELVAKSAGKLGRDDLLEKLLDDENYCVYYEAYQSFFSEHGYKFNSAAAYMRKYPNKIAMRVSKNGTKGVDLEFNNSKYFYPLDSVNTACILKWNGH